MLEVFDKADTNLTCARRNRSTIAPQALILMNNSFVISQSRENSPNALSSTAGRDSGQADRASL